MKKAIKKGVVARKTAAKKAKASKAKKPKAAKKTKKKKAAPKKKKKKKKKAAPKKKKKKKKKAKKTKYIGGKRAKGQHKSKASKVAARVFPSRNPIRSGAFVFGLSLHIGEYGTLQTFSVVVSKRRIYVSP